MCENAYLSMKSQKLPGPLRGPWSLAADCLICSCDSASLRRQLCASEAGPPLDQILDPHLQPADRLRIRNLMNMKFLLLMDGVL